MSTCTEIMNLHGLSGFGEPGHALVGTWADRMEASLTCVY
jgi:hypothetical protein